MLTCQSRYLSPPLPRYVLGTPPTGLPCCAQVTSASNTLLIAGNSTANSTAPPAKSSANVAAVSLVLAAQLALLALLALLL